jgi:hypothetical protein
MKSVTIQYAAFNDYKFRCELEVDKNHNDEDILDAVWAGFNAGSGKEMGAFLVAKVRSMSVGDFVRIDSQWFRCASFGWDQATENEVINATI